MVGTCEFGVRAGHANDDKPETLEYGDNVLAAKGLKLDPQTR
jgi:hypothetical protein